MENVKRTNENLKSNPYFKKMNSLHIVKSSGIGKLTKEKGEGGLVFGQLFHGG